MIDWITPEWPAPDRVKALVTTRQDGVSVAPWASLNLGDHVGDDPSAVRENRARLRGHLPSEPKWLRQTHSTICVDAASVAGHTSVEADASFTRQPGVVCTVLTADCLPVFFCDDQGSVVAVAHAGWRGLAKGVLEDTVAAMHVNPTNLLAWLGPAIGPQKFEVGSEVREIFLNQNEATASAFAAAADGKFLADIYRLARIRLHNLGISHVGSSQRGDRVDQHKSESFCTVRQSEQFFSYRRDGVTGRMASCIWLA